MSQHTYTVWIYKSSATNVATTADVAYTYSAQLQTVPEPQRAHFRPLEGYVESRSWGVDLVDAGSTVTGILADSTGRYHLLNRLVAVRRAVDSSASTWYGVGRVTAVTLNPDVASYRLTLEDENHIVRNTEMFSTNTTYLYPPGPCRVYGPFLVPDPTRVLAAAELSTTPARKMLVHVEGGAVDFPTLLTAITDDKLGPEARDPVSPSTATGNFEHLRLRVWSTAVTAPTSTNYAVDVPVIAFLRPGQGGLSPADEPEVGLSEGDWEVLAPPGGAITGLRCVVYDGSSAIAVGPSGQYVALHKMTAPPSEMTPLHIDSTSLPGFGEKVGTLLRRIYRGDFCASTYIVPQVSTAALDALETETRLPLVRYRVTEANVSMSRWLEDNVYGVNQIVPVVDVQGRLAPQHTLLPQSSSGVTRTWTGAQLRQPHPTWSNDRGEQVTAIDYRYTHEMTARVLKRAKFTGQYNAGGIPIYRYVNANAQPSMPPGADGIAVEARGRLVEQRSSVYGRKAITVNAAGWHTEYIGAEPGPLQALIQYLNGNKATPNADAMGAQVLSRYADGPVTGVLHAMSTVEAAQPGEYVTVTLGSYPTANSRGASRVVQLLGRQDTPQGPIFSYLDAGPSAQPSTAPTLSVAAGPAGSTKHSITVTIGNVHGQTRLQLAGGATQPAAGAGSWTDVATVSSSQARVIRSLPSGTTWWARAWNIVPNRWNSSYTYSTKQATVAITAPSAIAASTVGTLHAGLTWTPGDTDYPLHVYADTSTSATFTAANRVTILPGGSNRVTLAPLSSNTKYLVGIRHHDPYGGYSNSDSTTFTTLNTTAGIRVAPVPGLTLLIGGSA